MPLACVPGSPGGVGMEGILWYGFMLKGGGGVGMYLTGRMEFSSELCLNLATCLWTPVTGFAQQGLSSSPGCDGSGSDVGV